MRGEASMSISKPGIALATLAMLGAPMLLGGCFESDKAPAATGSICQEGVGESPLGLACANAPGASAANTSEEASRVTIYTNTSIRYDDVIPASERTCVGDPAPPLPCVDYNAADARRLHAVGTGNYTHVKLTLSWQAAGPTNVALIIAIMNQTKAADGTTQLHYLNVSASGESPLTLEGDIRPHDEKNPVLIYVLPSPGEAGPAYYRATLDQPFHVEGTITTAKQQP